MKNLLCGIVLPVLFLFLFTDCKNDSASSQTGSQVGSPTIVVCETLDTTSTKKTLGTTNVSTNTDRPPSDSTKEGSNPEPLTPYPFDNNTNRKVVSAKANMKNYCSGATVDIDTKILAAAQALSGFEYSSARQSDCSGMFHKMLDKMRETCPDANMPLISEARSTRGIAQWYHDNGNFEIIHDAESKGDLIKPGMVMFFGYGNKLDQYDFPNLTIDKLTTRGTGINHVAIVTSVETKDGKVVSYKMFHGRRPGKPSGITGSDWKPTRAGLPSYGNWKEPWIGVANLFAPKNEI